MFVCPSIFFSFKFFAISFLEVIFLKVCQKGLDFKVLLRLLFPLFSFQVIYADLAWSFMKFYAFRFCSVSYNLYFFICCFNLLFSPPINAEIPEGNLLFIISNKIQDFYRNITWAEFFPNNFFQIFQVNYFPREAIARKAKLLIKRLKCKMILLGKFGWQDN